MIGGQSILVFISIVMERARSQIARQNPKLEGKLRSLGKKANERMRMVLLTHESRLAIEIIILAGPSAESSMMRSVML